MHSFVANRYVISQLSVTVMQAGKTIVLEEWTKLVNSHVVVVGVIVPVVAVVGVADATMTATPKLAECK